METRTSKGVSCEIKVSQVAILDFRLKYDPESPHSKCLRASIREHGVVSPIIVRRLPADKRVDGYIYELLDGVARLEIAKELGHKLIVAIVKLGE